MGVIAPLALRDRLTVIDTMADRLDGSQVCVQGFEVAVCHVAVDPPWHGNVQWARAHVTRADRLYEQGFVVIGNAARIGSDVGGRDVSELFEHVPARQVHTRQWTAHIVFWSVAIVASADGGQVPSTRNRI